MSTRLSSRVANQLISFLMDEGEESGLGIAAAVCDPYGELISFSRTDACCPVSIKVAIAKAYSAARLQKSTRAFYEEGFELANLADEGYSMYPGGFPILSNGITLGGIGVSGLAPEEDEALVLKALDFCSLR